MWPRRATRLIAVVTLGMPVVPVVVTGALAASTAATAPAPAAGDSATVTVSKANGLVNEAVEVSWAGFSPSSGIRLLNSGGSPDINTLNPVRVYQCRGAAPASSSDCYGSPGFPGIPAINGQPSVDPVPGFIYPGQTDVHDGNPDGPSNYQDTVTAADGTGHVTVQVFTKREAPSLGCDESTACSLVVVPNYGRDNGTGATEDQQDAPWAWARRTVIPLSFAPLGAACPFADAALAVEGSPSSARLFDSWRVGTCTATQSVGVDYTAVGEPQTRQDVAAGFTQAGLVSRPLSSEESAARQYAYAPLSVTGLVVAFQVDDVNGQQVTSMRLNPRLVAKMITASYRVADDPNVVGNPANLFLDPEFRALNPGVAWPFGSPGNHVVMLADLSDLTWTLTRWIASDKDARAFIDGQPDPWGMHVNLAYKSLALPVSTFPVLDAHQSNSFQPIQGLDQVARQLSIAQFPGAVTTVEDGQNVVTKPPRQNPGSREVIGIMDAADAAAFLLPTADLLNSGGAYVAPSPASMKTTLAHMRVDRNGVTRSVDLSDKSRAVYPLTMVNAAVAPLDLPAKQRQVIARFLGYAAGAGQVPGTSLGQMPDGYVPLTPDLLALTRAARTAVLRGPLAQGNPKDTSSGAGSSGGQGGGGGNIDGGAGAGGVDGAGAGDVPGTDAGPVTTTGTPAVTPSPQLAAQRVAGLRSGVSGAMVLPALAVAGLVLLLVGGFAGGPGVGLRRPELWSSAAQLPRKLAWRHR